jgi:hypothetical protein
MPPRNHEPRHPHHLLVAATLCALLGDRLAAAAPPERSVSTSRQFIVYGPDVRLRGAICEIGERVKKETLALLRQPDGWKTPIVVNAQPAQGEPAGARAGADELQPDRLRLEAAARSQHRQRLKRTRH